MVYLFVLHSLAKKCTKIYNACRTIVRLIKPFALRRFRCARFRLYKVHAVVIYKKSRCRHISVLFASKFQANETVRPVVFHTGKVFTIRPWKFPEIHTGIFGQIESAPCPPTLRLLFQIWREAHKQFVSLTEGDILKFLNAEEILVRSYYNHIRGRWNHTPPKVSVRLLIQ